MRAGGNCTVQQGLSPEATGLVTQAVVLAKRRGHAQVTPLHVASTMLSAPGGLFRAACQESHSHPLQCKALELCFNVALNRLPAASAPSSSSISNALVAAFKRAQAHQRRGSIETNQPPPLLSVKIELDQLVVSILDDPSVSRVMREAGFSSTQVKNNVEKSLSLELCNNSKASKATNPLQKITNDDIKAVIECLLARTKRRSIVLVGQSTSNLEATIRGLMDKVEEGDVPEALTEVKFVSIPPFYTFCNMYREELDRKVQELTSLVKSLVGKGVVLYLGDLKWISEYRDSSEQQRSYYCSVEHMMMEIGRLVWGIGETERFWVVGIATFQTYMRCRNGYHSLQSVWGLHPVTIPANTLGFSLDDEKGERVENERCGDGEVQLSCCSECSEKFEDEARSLHGPTFSNLPTWLKNESRRLKSNDHQEAMKELRKKWNTHCSSAHNHHRHPGGTLTPLISSTPPASSSTSLDQPDPGPTGFRFPLFEPTWKHNWPSNPTNGLEKNGELRNASSSDPSSTPNSGSSSDIMDMDYTQKFKEFNSENLNILCNALEEKVPCQREIIPEIAGTILQCRSGMVRRKDSSTSSDAKEETWLLFLGPDEAQAKERISRELAKVVFGSYSSFLSSSFVSPDSSDGCRNKDMNRLGSAVRENPHRVFFMEEADIHWSQMGIKRAIERGRISDGNGGEVGFGDAIIVLSFRSRSRASSPEKEGGGGGGLLDLNISFGDDVDTVEDESAFHDLGILQTVDRRVLFKSRDLLL